MRDASVAKSREPNLDLVQKREGTSFPSSFLNIRFKTKFSNVLQSWTR